MRVFLTGASGFVGAYVLQELLRRGYAVRCLVRTPGGLPAETATGDVTRPESLRGLMEGCDAVIHLVGIIEERPRQGITFEAMHVEATRHVIAEAARTGITRFVHMSANGASKRGASRYQTTKWQAEELVRQSALPRWTILRPSLIFGDPGPDRMEFCTRLAGTLIKRSPILPVFGRGDYSMQPIAVETVAAACVQALELDAACNGTFCLGGKDRYSYIEILDVITRGLGQRPKPKIPIPISIARAGLGTVGRWGQLPITRDQFEMLIRGNTCDESKFYDVFGIPCKPFTVQNLAYLRQRV